MSSVKYLALFIVTICTTAACSKKTEKPERPENVPSTTVPAIGADGGAWADCSFIKPPHAYCELYFSATGEIWARGNYRLTVDDEVSEIESAEHLKQLMLGFRLFNGRTIDLEGTTRLVPDGVIDSPFPQGGGKTVEYSMGRSIGPEKQYGD